MCSSPPRIPLHAPARSIPPSTVDHLRRGWWGGSRMAASILATRMIPPCFYRMRFCLSASNAMCSSPVNSVWSTVVFILPRVSRIKSCAFVGSFGSFPPSASLESVSEYLRRTWDGGKNELGEGDSAPKHSAGLGCCAGRRCATAAARSRCRDGATRKCGGGDFPPSASRFWEFPAARRPDEFDGEHLRPPAKPGARQPRKHAASFVSY